MEALSNDKRDRKFTIVAGFAVVMMSCFRLAHVQLLWADEDYHLAAAINILHGKVPYRDFWYDKPPLTAIYYVLIGGWSGWALRILDAAYILACCLVAYRFARSWWGPVEGTVAALLLAFFTTFYLPSAVIPFAADAVMMLPHLLAIYCAFRGRVALAGILAGTAFLANTKAVFVLASCCLFLIPQIPLLVACFAVTTGAGLVSLVALGAWPGYVEQVWQWGLVYAKGSPVIHPWSNGIIRVLNWMGFHALLVSAAGYGMFRVENRERMKLGGWLALSFVAVAIGSRFAPHYFLQLLPPLVIAGARGLTLAFERNQRLAIAAVIVLAAIPVIRFAPRYASLAADPQAQRWSDVAMDLDSRSAARRIMSQAQPGDNLFVWGYRPDIYVFSRMVSDSRYWDSQPLTGVPADRHLSATTAIYGGPAERNRQELAKSHPTWIVDGLGLMNPALRLGRYVELQPWLAQYDLVGQTRLSLIYRRKAERKNEAK